MRSFALKCLAFVALLGATAALMEYKLRSLQDRYLVKRTRFEAGLHDWQVVVTGSSPEENGINSGRLGVPTFNLATRGQTLYYDTQLISKYVGRLNRLRLVIVGVSYLSLEYEFSESNSGAVFLYWRDWAIPIEPFLSGGLDIRKHSLLAVYTPRGAFEHMLNGFHVDAIDQIDANGWDRSFAGHQSGSVEAMTKELMATHHRNMWPHVLPKNIARLDGMFSLLKAHGIAVAVIKMPVSQAYFDSEVVTRRAAMDSALAVLCRGHGIVVHDYSRDARVPPDDFYNAVHLNVQGADRFSQIVAEEIVRPNLATTGMKGEAREAR